MKEKLSPTCISCCARQAVRTAEPLERKFESRLPSPSRHRSSSLCDTLDDRKNLPEAPREPAEPDEILGLEWRNVDFRAGEVRLDPGATKNGEAHMFPFSAYPPLGELLKWQRQRTAVVEKTTKRIVSHVFHRGGRPVLDFRGAWQKACDAAGVRGRLVHDFRRTAVRNLERAPVFRTPWP